MTTADPPATSATRPDGFHVEETPPPPEVQLARFRAAFPRWAFFHNEKTGVWTALRGDDKTGITIRRPTAFDLLASLQELPWWQQQ